MALTDNRTLLNDCEDDAQTFTTSGAQLGTSTLTGQFIEGSASVQAQHSNTYDDTYTSGDSAGNTFNLGAAGADTTIYFGVKDNLMAAIAAAGGMIVLGDGTDRIGYTCIGGDVVGFPYANQYLFLKLDTSDAAANPGTADVDHHVFAGVEANLNFSGITIVGFGTLHNAKAQGNVPNVFIDNIRYIANDSYAATINGGTGATPETMLDVVGDDVALGAGMFNNPKGSEFGFFAPTEWGHATAETAFTAAGEQWYFYGNNSGSRSVGVTHFPQRVFGGSGTNLWTLDGVVLVNIGAPAEFDLSDTNMDTLTIVGGSWVNFGTIALPDSSVTTASTTGVIFTGCAQITNNGADMDGCSILDSTVAADVGALLYNEASDPDGTLDNLTIESSATAHHAIDFGTNVDSSLTAITLRGINFNGFGAVDDANASTVRFLATTGSLTLNLIDCTVDGVSPVASGGGQNFSVDDAAGITVTVVVQPVTLEITVKDSQTLAVIQNVQTSIHLSASPFTELMNEDTTAGGIASESYAGATPVEIVWKCRKSDDLDSPRYFGASGVDTITSDGFTLTVLLEQNPFLT
jgi:hypothetical protein